MVKPSMPTEAERKAFVVKLAEFRNTLPLVQQEMLDALVGAAVTGRAPADLARYWVGPQLHPASDVDPDRPPTTHR